jgi:hypothetical protein
MTPQDLIRSFQPRLQDPREILHELTRPRESVATEPQIVAKDAAQVERERHIMRDMGTLQSLLTGSPIGARAAFVDSDSVTRAKTIATRAEAAPELAGALLMLSAALMDHRAWCIDAGLWPLPDHFGAESYAVPRAVVTPLPSLWESTFPGVQAPDLATVESLME